MVNPGGSELFSLDLLSGKRRLLRSSRRDLLLNPARVGSRLLYERVGRCGQELRLGPLDGRGSRPHALPAAAARGPGRGPRAGPHEAGRAPALPPPAEADEADALDDRAHADDRLRDGPPPHGGRPHDAVADRGLPLTGVDSPRADLARVQGQAPRRARRPRPAGPVPHRRLPGALGRADAAHAARRVDVHDRRRGRRAGALDAGRSSARCRARRSRATSTASRSGRSSTRPGRASRSTRCSTRWSTTPLRRWRSATAATRRTCRSRTSSTARRGSRTATTASRSTPSTAARRACSSRTSTSGRARSGCAASTLRDDDEPGFWESNGYHIHGDPWREQRYWGD